MNQEAMGKAREIKDQISETAAGQLGRGVGAIKDKALQFAEEQRRSGADRLGDFAQAARRAASEIEPQSPLAAKYIHQAAVGIERASDRLREHSFDELTASFSRFARERPATLFAGAVVAGLALTWLIGRSRS